MTIHHQSTTSTRASERVEPAAASQVGGTAHVVLPAYEEEASLPSLLARLAAQARTERLVVWVVDDGSADDTAAIATEGVPGLEVRLVSHPQNLGLGQAVQSGLRAVLAAAGSDDFVVVMDADDTHDPAMLGVLRSALADGADIAICSRFVPGGDDTSAPPFRRLLSRGAGTVFRRALSLDDDVHDFTSGFRAYRVALLVRAAEHWGERLVEERGFACMVELLLKLRHCRPRIVEVPLVLRYDRKQSESKLRLARTVRQYLALLTRDRLSPAPYRAL